MKTLTKGFLIGTALQVARWSSTRPSLNQLKKKKSSLMRTVGQLPVRTGPLTNSNFITII